MHEHTIKALIGMKFNTKGKRSIKDEDIEHLEFLNENVYKPDKMESYEEIIDNIVEIKECHALKNMPGYLMNRKYLVSVGQTSKLIGDKLKGEENEKII